VRRSVAAGKACRLEHTERRCYRSSWALLQARASSHAWLTTASVSGALRLGLLPVVTMPVCNGIVALEVTYGVALGSAGFHRLTRGGESVSINTTGGAVYLWFKNGRAGALRDVLVVHGTGDTPPTIPEGYTRATRNLLNAEAAADGATTYLCVSATAGPDGQDQYIVGLSRTCGDEQPGVWCGVRASAFTHTVCDGAISSNMDVVCACVWSSVCMSVLRCAVLRMAAPDKRRWIVCVLYVQRKAMKGWSHLLRTRESRCT